MFILCKYLNFRSTPYLGKLLWLGCERDQENLIESFHIHTLFLCTLYAEYVVLTYCGCMLPLYNTRTILYVFVGL